ncbi:LIM and SH3 domain protein Lasp [Pectinophora gossypiella]|nr:LIM and SH3 domain protein Lasp [Pectinophora gossypiella]
MNKTCARCEKTVYPTEELKCLDKVWHKGCFKCQECGMTLNMRTYKGYGKLPYCEAHVPKAKPTTMAETPELKRIAENTKIQSNVKYHADFERSKGKFTQVADDPETLRIKANTKIISNVAYHGDLEKKAQMERQRQINENGELVDVPSENYHQQLETYATEMLPTPAPNLPPKNHYQTPVTQYQSRPYRQEQFKEPYQQKPEQYQQKQDPYQQKQDPYQQKQDPYQQKQDPYQQKQDPYQQKQDPYQPKQEPYQQKQEVYQNKQENYQTKPEQYQKQEYSEQYYRQQKYEEYYNQYPKYDEYQNQNQNQNQHQHPNQNQNINQNQYAYGQYTQQNYGVGSQQKIGRIQDYDPLSDGPRAPPNTQRASATLIYNSTSDAKRGSHQVQQQQSRQIGRVADLDPLATEQSRVSNHHQQNQRVYIAMYDYEANDSDEVSFREGDLISNVTSIDEGWMTGQVLRTRRTGMLPANYVELAPAQTMH